MNLEALKMGFRHVESGPLVRSSYHAHEQADAATGMRMLV
jgi:lipoic acid synthetase